MQSDGLHLQIQPPIAPPIEPAADDQPSSGVGMGAVFCILFIIVGVFNLAFIIPDLIYAYGGSQCVNTIVQGISFSLKTWLQVDAYLRIALTGLLLVVALASCCSLTCGMALGTCVMCFMLIYSLFALAWTIVGSVLFWGRLNPTGVCTGGVQAYTFALLIITYVSICCNCVYSLGKKGQGGGDM